MGADEFRLLGSQPGPLLGTILQAVKDLTGDMGNLPFGCFHKCGVLPFMDGLIFFWKIQTSNGWELGVETSIVINHCPGDPPCIDLCCYAGGCPQTIRWLKDRSDDREFPSHRIETHNYRWNIPMTISLITLWLCQNSYWKWSFIVDLSIKNGWMFHSFL